MHPPYTHILPVSTNGPSLPLTRMAEEKMCEHMVDSVLQLATLGFCCFVVGLTQGLELARQKPYR